MLRRIDNPPVCAVAVVKEKPEALGTPGKCREGHPDGKRKQKNRSNRYTHARTSYKRRVTYFRTRGVRIRETAAEETRAILKSLPGRCKGYNNITPTRRGTAGRFIAAHDGVYYIYCRLIVCACAWNAIMFAGLLVFFFW